MIKTIFIQFIGKPGSGRTTMQRFIKELLFKENIEVSTSGEHQLKFEVHTDFLRELQQNPQGRLAQ